MKIKLTEKLKDLTGKVMLINPADSKSEATLKTIIPIIMLGTYKGHDDNLGAEEKLRRFNIAKNVSDCLKGEIDLPLEDVAYIKKLAGIGCDSLTYGRLSEILDGGIKTGK